MRKTTYLIAVVVLTLFLAISWVVPASAYLVVNSWARFGCTAGETLTTGDVVAIKDADGYCYKADADDSTIRPAVGIVNKGGASGASVEVVTLGVVSGWTSLAEGGTAYLSGTAGAVTQTAPDWIQQLGYAISTTRYMFNFANTGLTDMGTLDGASPIVLEGATADAYETTITVTDPTADRTITLPNATGATVISSLTTNAPDAANSISGASNSLVFEGATANDYETSITPTDPTADRSVVLPDTGGTVMLSSLATNGADAANAVTGASNALVYEGTADAYEVSLTAADATADRTIDLPDYTGSVPLVIQHDVTGYTATNQTTDATSLSLSDGWFTAGKAIRFSFAGTLTGANAGKQVLLYVDDAAKCQLDIAAATTGDFVGSIVIAEHTDTANQTIFGEVQAPTDDGDADLQTDTTDFNDGGATTVKLQIVSGNAGDTITLDYVLVELLP